jgi:hypothetical protein
MVARLTIAAGPRILVHDQPAADAVLPTLTTAAMLAGGLQVRLTFSEAISGNVKKGWTFSASGGPVTVVSGTGRATTVVTLTLSRSILGETVTVSYSPTTGDLCDKARNDLAAITNQTVLTDLVPPTLNTATILSTGVVALFQFSEPVSTSTAPPPTGLTITSNAGGPAFLSYSTGLTTANLTFGISRPILVGEIIQWHYTPGNITDVAGNPLAAAANRTVNNASSQQGDVTPPLVSSASIAATGNTLAVVFNEPVQGTSGLTISASGGPSTLTYQSGTGTTTLTYSLSRQINVGETVTRSYSPGNIADISNNLLVGFTNQPVTNGSSQTPPFVSTAVVQPSGSAIVFTFNESVTGNNGLTISATPAASLTFASGTGNTRNYNISRVIQASETVTRNYAPGNIVDTAGYPLAAFSNQPVQNGSSQGTSPIYPPTYADWVDKFEGRVHIMGPRWTTLATNDQVIGYGKGEAWLGYLKAYQHFGNTAYKAYGELAAQRYRDAYILPNNGGVPGYYNYSEGFAVDWLMNGDTLSQEAVVDLSLRGTYAADTTRLVDIEGEALSREVSYGLMAWLLADVHCNQPWRTKTLNYMDILFGNVGQQVIGVPPSPVENITLTSGGHIEQWLGGYQTDPNTGAHIPGTQHAFADAFFGYAPFMGAYLAFSGIKFNEFASAGLLINNLGATVGPDPRVLPKLIRLADATQNEMWDPAVQAHLYRWGDASGAPDLSTVIFPWFAWLFLQTGKARFRIYADDTFAGSHDPIGSWGANGGANPDTGYEQWHDFMRHTFHGLDWYAQGRALHGLGT